MTKNEIEAIRVLPPRFVADGTLISEVSNMDGKKYVVAINSGYAPIVYSDKKIGWKKMKLSHSPNTNPAIMKFP
jgi:hypothetical protein